METLNIKKRKKRKTRRCLDELRKKTNEANDVCRTYKHTDSNAKANSNKSSCMRNNYITNSRLTLFRKAIRSETVTRVQLAELESKKLHLNKCRETVTKHANDSDIESNNNVTVRKEDIHIENVNSGIEENPSQNSDAMICNYVDSPKSIPLFSPESPHKEISTEPNSPYEISLPSSSSTPTLNTVEPENDICNHIIDGIELYLEEEYPHIFKSMDEKMEKTKAELVSLFRKTVTFNSDTTGDSTPNMDSSSPEEQYSSPNVPIIQNPRDYIAYSQVQRSAESKTSGIQVSSPSGSSTSVLIHVSSPSPLVAAVNDTPEYHYFPHRLNN